MTDRDARIDRLARAFVDAATALADEMARKLGDDAPALAVQVAQALEQGERMQLSLEFHPSDTAIVWVTVDDYQHTKRIMTIPGRPRSRH